MYRQEQGPRPSSGDDEGGGEGGAIAPGSAVDDVPHILACSDAASSPSCEKLEVCRVREASGARKRLAAACSGGYHFPSPASRQPSPWDVLPTSSPLFRHTGSAIASLNRQWRKGACCWLLTTVARVPQRAPRTRRHVTVSETGVRRSTGVNGVVVVLGRWRQVSRKKRGVVIGDVLRLAGPREVPRPGRSRSCGRPSQASFRYPQAVTLVVTLPANLSR